MTIEEILKTKRGAILDTAAHYGVTKIRVFGSAARGEAGPESDIDFLVEFTREIGLVDYVALKQDLEDLLGVAVDLVAEDSLHQRIRERVLQEATPL